MDDSSKRFELVELFMAKAGTKGWDRCFYGTIRRETDADGNPVVIGKINVNDGYIIAKKGYKPTNGNLAASTPPKGGSGMQPASSSEDSNNSGSASDSGQNKDD